MQVVAIALRFAIRSLAAVAVMAGLPCPASAAGPAPTPAQLLEQAQAAWDRLDVVAMDSLGTRALELLDDEAAPDTLQLGTAHLRLAQGRYGQFLLADSTAIRSAERALDLLPRVLPADDLLVGEAHDVLAGILGELHRAADALPHARTALEIRRAKLGDVHDDVAAAWYRLGITFDMVGEPDSSIAALRTAIDVRLRGGNPGGRRIGDYHSEIATVLERTGRREEARAELDAMLEAYESRVGPTHPAMCQGLQRYSAFVYREGDLARSADMALRAVEIAEASPGFNPGNLALLRGNLGVVLGEIGDHVRARALFEEVLPVFEARLGPNHARTLWARFQVGYSQLALEDTAGARASLEAVCAAPVEETAVTDPGLLAQAHLGLGQILATSDPAAALAHADDAERLERARPAPNGRTLTGAQSLKLHATSLLGRWDEVDRIAARLQGELDTHGLRGTDNEAVALATMSRAAVRRGRPDEGMRLARAAAEVSRRELVRNARALPDRQGLLLAGRRSAPLELLLAQGLAGDAAHAPAVWDELIRWRGLVRAEVARRRAPREGAADPTARDAHRAFAEAQRKLARLEVELAGDPGEDAAAQLAAARSTAEDAERRWLAVAPRDPSLADPAETGLDEVRGRLPGDAVLVGFATVEPDEGPARLAAFVVAGKDRAKAARDAVRMVDLGELGPVSAQIARWLAVAGRPPAGSANAEARCREEGLRLRRLVWDPLAPFLADARDLHLVPDGPLVSVPWGALPSGPQGYLVETDLRIHVLEAERDLAARPAPAGKGVLAVGGVDFDLSAPSAAAPMLLAASTRAVIASCVGIPDDFAPLPGSLREVEEIARLDPAARILRGADATEARFKEMAAGRRVLHLATHAVVLADSCEAAAKGMRGVGGVAPVEEDADGVADASSPWLARRVLLALAGANRAREHDRDENEGLLTAEEVSTLDLRDTEWVVLSACQSAAGSVVARQGLSGMTRAFHLAGVPVVIASQWAVDDDATRDWMTRLYRARREGAKTAAEAMQRASRDILRARRAAGQGTHPFAWAAFTASGD